MRITLDIPLNINEIASSVNGTLCEIKNDIVISALSTDSRDIKKGDLFFALKGEKYNGESFLNDIYDIGAIPITAKKNVPGICVGDTSSALSALAAFYKTKLTNLKYTVGITGSVGKTTTKEFLGILLSGSYKTHRTEGNFNNKIGLPLTILSAPHDTEILILEMGMNHKGEISELSKCASPDVALITNIGTSHIGNLGSRENIALAKSEILDGMQSGCVIVPKSEPLLSHLPTKCTFSTDDPDADIYIIYNEGKIKIIYQSTTVDAQFELFAPQHLDCLAASAAAALKCGVDLQNIKRQIPLISNKNTRQNTFFVQKFYILSDFYNASLESTAAALEQLKNIDGFSERSALLGDISELGSMSEIIHRKIGRKCAKIGLSRLYLFGTYSKFIKDEAIICGMEECRIFLNENTEKPEITANMILKNSAPGELILFKASRSQRLERIVEILQRTD